MNIVVDCSFIMSSILPDENEDKIENIFYGIAKNQYKVYVPSIFYLECTNVLLSSLNSKRIAQDSFEEYTELLSLLPITLDKFCTTPESLYSIGNLAKKYNLTSYDASYLDVAMRMEASVATLDRELVKVCRNAKIELLV